MRTLAESTVDCTAPPEAVWAIWADPALRPAWHPRLEWATQDGPPAPGVQGRWKPDRAKPVDVTVAEAVPGARLVFAGTHGHGPRLAQGHYEHEVRALPGGGSRITHRMRLSGALAVPLSLVLGRMLGVSASPEAVRELARLAEERSGSGGQPSG